MKKDSLLLRITLILLLLLGCNVIQLGQKTASTPMPSKTPTPLPVTPTHTPVSILGITEPIIVKGISVTNNWGISEKKDLELQILGAEVKESLQSGDSEPVYPDDRSTVFMDIFFSSKSLDASDWLALNANLICDTRTYQPERYGINIGDEGFLESVSLIFAVPSDSHFSGCALQLSNQREIPLATFFDDTTK